MIYTVTFNPAIDYVMKVGNLDLGKVVRSSDEEIFFGGKGINVSIILSRLELKTKALGFIAGFTGEAIEKGVKNEGVETDFVKLDNGFSRINVKIKTDVETDLNGQGPKISQKKIDELFEKLNQLKSGDILVLAGSIPDSLPEDIYEKILEKLSGRGIEFVVDATKDLLLNVLQYKPFLIKPNNHELSEIFGKELKTDKEIADAAKVLQQRGAKNVLVSMASKGAILVDENKQVYKIGTTKGKVVNSVGAGDSMVAGFIAGYRQKNDYEYALKLGSAAGEATTFSEGLADKQTIDYRFKNLQPITK